MHEVNNAPAASGGRRAEVIRRIDLIVLLRPAWR
jgi:hypothetical protein